jgi:hypothetical protein
MVTPPVVLDRSRGADVPRNSRVVVKPVLFIDALWLVLWLASAVMNVVNETGDVYRDMSHVLILLAGVVAEAFRWRLAVVINVGYFLAYGGWLFFLLARDLWKPSPEPGGLALVVALIGVPMIISAALIAVAYRRAHLSVRVPPI